MIMFQLFLSLSLSLSNKGKVLCWYIFSNYIIFVSESRGHNPGTSTWNLIENLVQESGFAAAGSTKKKLPCRGSQWTTPGHAEGNNWTPIHLKYIHLWPNCLCWKFNINTWESSWTHNNDSSLYYKVYKYVNMYSSVRQFVSASVKHPVITWPVLNYRYQVNPDHLLQLLSSTHFACIIERAGNFLPSLETGRWCHRMLVHIDVQSVNPQKKAQQGFTVKTFI